MSDIYISRNELLQLVKVNAPYLYSMIGPIALLAEPLPIINCKDCKNCVSYPAGYFCYDPRDVYTDGVEVKAEDFCSYGERKDDATD